MKPLVKRLAWLALFPPAAVWPSAWTASKNYKRGGKPGWRSWISTRSIKRAAWTGCCWKTMCTVRWRSLRAT